MDQNEQDTMGTLCLINEDPEGKIAVLPATEDWCGCCETPHARFKVRIQVDVSSDMSLMTATVSFIREDSRTEEMLYVNLKKK